MAETLVELTQSETVLARHGRELIRHDRQRIELDPELVATARRNLLSGQTLAERDYLFGFMLGVEQASGSRPALELVARLDRELVGPVGRCRDVQFELSFLKAVEGVVPDVAEGPLFAGFHLDTHPEMTADGGPELLRILVNLASEPRTLRFIHADRFELVAAGLDLPRSSFQVVEAPLHFRHATVVIPPFDGREISYLTFWASVVPHVGVENEGGHFLASFEAVAAYR